MSKKSRKAGIVNKLTSGVSGLLKNHKIDTFLGDAKVVAKGKVDVKGPKGTLSRPLTPNVKVKVENNEVQVVPTVQGRDGALAVGVMHVLFKEGYADWDYLRKYTDAPDELLSPTMVMPSLKLRTSSAFVRVSTWPLIDDTRPRAPVPSR